LILLVLNNQDLNQVTWEQQDVPDFPYARFAELLSSNGIRVIRRAK
jgi:pyruvate dehydrogenase (quinone)